MTYFGRKEEKYENDEGKEERGRITAIEQTNEINEKEIRESYEDIGEMRKKEED
jgi:hypothetical protein